MGRRGRAVLGLVAIALIAGLAWWSVAGGSRDEGASVAATRPPGEPVTSEPAELPAISPAGSPSVIETHPATDSGAMAVEPGAPASVAVLIVTLVRDTDQSPVAKTWLRIWVWTDPKHDRGATTIVRTEADGSGRVEFPFPVELHRIEAPPGDDHGYADVQASLSIALGETRRLTVRTSPGATVRGRVVDEREAPVPQATVLAWAEHQINLNDGEGPLPEPDMRTECDSAGRFELRGVGSQLTLMPAVEGLAALKAASGSFAEGAVDGAVAQDVTLVVGPGITLRGRVLDPFGQPVTQLWVNAGYMSYSSLDQPGFGSIKPLRSAARTDSNGAFAIGPIADKKWWVSTHREPYSPWAQLHTPDGSELLIQLAAGNVLEGLVFGADGAPLDGALVGLGGASVLEHGGGAGWTQTKTEAGRFAFTALVPTKQAALGVSAEGHAISVIEPLVVGEGESAPLEIQLEPERPIAGRIVDEHDAPIAGAKVSVRGDRTLTDSPWEDQTWEEWVWPRASMVQSDADGRFRLERLYDGLFELTVEDPRTRGLKHSQSVRSGGDELLIRLDAQQLRRAVLTGTVRDAETGLPVERFSVMLDPQEPERRQPGTRIPSGQFEDAGGAFTLQGMEPGRWRALVDADGYARARSDELELHDGEQHVELELLAQRSLPMRFLDQDGQPVSSAFVSFEDARGERIDLRVQPTGNNTYGMTDKAGELTAPGLPADRITIVIKVPLVPHAQVGTRPVRLPIDLRVQPEGVQEFTIERSHARCLVLSVHETDAVVPATVFDTDDESATEVLKPLIEQQLLRSVERMITVTVTDADGALIDTARCEPNPMNPKAWRVTSKVCASEGEPTSWLAAALPAGPSRAVIAVPGAEPVTLELPAGSEHVRRCVILRP